MSDWEIKKPLGECFGTSEEILPGQDYYAALVETDEGLQRRDYCSEYWEKETPSVYYYWRAKMPDEDSKKEIFIDDDMLMAFFERLENEEEAEKINFRFVLCLILMRKKMLRYKSSKIIEGHDIWTLKITGQKREVEVINPELTEDQIDELTQNIGKILQMDFE